MEQVVAQGKDAFSYLIKKIPSGAGRKFIIAMTLKGWGWGSGDYTPVSKTVFGKYMDSDEYSTNIEAQAALKKLRNLIEKT